jgi:GNAT superfamily N-acetyltransferase
VAALGLERVKETISSRATLIALVRPTSESRPPVLDRFRFRETTAGDGPLYARDIGTDSPGSFRARLTQSTRCFVVEDGGRLVHATWMTRRGAWTREVRGYFRPPPGEAYVYESYTRPEARGHGIYPFALLNIAAWLAARRVHRVWIAIEADNPSSLRAVAKAGFEPAFEISYRRLFGHLSVGAPVGELAHECAECFVAKTGWKKLQASSAHQRSKG